MYMNIQNLTEQKFLRIIVLRLTQAWQKEKMIVFLCRTSPDKVAALLGLLCHNDTLSIKALQI